MKEEILWIPGKNLKDIHGFHFKLKKKRNKNYFIDKTIGI